ncbi:MULTISPECIES: MFS transporter [Clostridium]|uniref:MFS transporter n=1 Tax=Clostridium cibarium TaxID=2762247 RepID=A0ABR8PWB2_9CLOT|nr:MULTISPECIES: MFS transporter [Clostridium]MBD7912429.1 MFS transporter [Clostridium cibarium]
MKSLNKEEKSWAFYDWGNSAYSMIITSTILPIYFKLAAQEGGVPLTDSTAYWGYAVSISTLIVSILAPILGAIADYKGYKKNFFKLFFTLGVISTLCLAMVPSDKPLILLIMYAFTVVGFSGANIFYDSFLVDVTDESRMDKVSASGFALGYVGSTIPFVISIIIVLLSQKEVIPFSLSLSCKITFLITALWWGIFTLPLLKNVNQKYYIEKEPKIVVNSFKRIIETFKNIKSHKNIFIFLIAYFFYIDGVDTIINMATSYGTDLGISMTSLLIILLLTQFVAVPFTLIYGKLAKKVGTKKMLFVGIITYTTICIYAYFIKTALDFWILAMAVGSAQGGIQAISRSYFAKLVPKSKSNEFFGFYNIFGKFAAIMGPALVGIVTQVTGETNKGLISLVILFLIGGVILSQVECNTEHSKDSDMVAINNKLEKC